MICYQYPLTSFYSIFVYCQHIFSIVKSIIDFDDITWKFTFFTNRGKTNVKCIGYWAANYKSTCFRSNNNVSFFFLGKINNFINRGTKRFSIIHERGDIFKLDTLFWPVIYYFYMLFIINILLPPCLSLNSLNVLILDTIHL